MEKRNNSWFDSLKQTWRKLSKLLATVATGVIDVLNTATPPWFEFYILSEFIKIWNIDAIIWFLQKVLQEEIQKSKDSPWIIESKIIFWSQIERGTLWNMKDRYEELHRLRESNNGKRLGFI